MGEKVIVASRSIVVTLVIWRRKGWSWSLRDKNLPKIPLCPKPSPVLPPGAAWLPPLKYSAGSWGAGPKCRLQI